MDTGLLIIRILLAGIFALAGIAKFLDLNGSKKAFIGFGIPPSLAMPGAIALSIFEILIAVFLLPVETSWYAAVSASFLLILFVFQMFYQFARGNAPDCHCFGQLHSAPVSPKSIVRNILFVIPGIFLAYQGSRNQGTSLTDPRLDIMQLVFGTAVIGFLIAVVFLLRKISEQQTQIMRRIELLELISREGSSVERDEAGLPHEGLPIGAVVSDFELPDLNGEAVSLASLRLDDKPVLFFFVSPSCNPCKALVPEFEQWQSELGEKVKFVFVSNGKPDDNAAKFGGDAAKLILIQKEREVAALVKAQWTPTAVFMDRNGRIASHVAAGDSAIRELVEQIKADDLQQEFTYFTNGNGAHRIKIGDSVPDFSVTDIKGAEIDASYFKDRQTLVTFWSMTCPHCLNMMGDLSEWDKSKGKDEPALIVFSDGDKADLEELELKSPIILDDGHKTAAGFGMFGTPSAVLVNEQGKIITETAIGAPDIWSLIGKRK